MVERQQEYRQRLAEIDAAVAAARPAADVLLERASGLLAGRVGCRVGEAHAHLLRLAAEQGRPPRDVAAEVLVALEDRSTPVDTRRLRATVDRALRPAGRRTARRGQEPADWARIVQQMLDVVPGLYAALVPVRDRAGEVVDYTFVAASPGVVDLSGRHGSQIVGLLVSEAYPGVVVGGPIWDAWREVLADGLPREVGPIPYVGDHEHAPGAMSITIRAQAIGPGILNTWERHDEQNRLADRIAQTERLGNLGWGEWDMVTGEVVWSDEMYRIFERDPALGPLRREEQDALTLPEDEPLREQAADSFGRGETIDLTYRIRLGERVKYLRTVADTVRDAAGRPLRLYGITQDVTARETSRTRLAEVERQLREHQRSLAAEHQVAAQLQQIVLPIPATPIDLPGLRVAVRYLPAEQAGRVGGDWYHAAALDDGRVMLAVGDVAGHGIRAAAVMAQLRHVLAALTVTTTSDPAELLAYLNRLLYAEALSSGTATAIVGRYDPQSRELVWAQAGHPAPLHSRGGETTVLARPRGPLLGAIRDARYATESLTLAGGDLLLFYTDGLVERRDHSLDEGLAPIVDTLSRISAAGSRQPLADLLDQLPRANPDDDTCVVAARPRPHT